MCPNNKVDDDTVKEIKDLSDHLPLRYIAKKTGLHVNTVRKYARETDISNDKGI